MTIDRETLAFYDGNPNDYAAYSAEAAEHPKLEAFIAAVPEGGRVLDFGCGIGWAAAAMVQAGLVADAMDASAGLAGVAKERYDLDVRVGDFVFLSKRNRYDGIWSHFALQHAARSERPAIFERIFTALKPGGLFYLGAQKGPLDWRDDVGRLYSPFTDANLDSLLTDAGFTDVRYEYGTGKNYDGTPTLGVYAWARAGDG